MQKPLPAFKVVKTTEERYEDMLGAVPPIGFGGSYFLCGEPVDQRECGVTGKIEFTYEGFFASEDHENFYTVDEAVTKEEFRQLIREVAALATPEAPAEDEAALAAYKSTHAAALP